MRNIFTCLVVSLLLILTSAFSDDRGTPWLVSWPFFQNAQTPHSIQSGYGDWCIIDEGAHPGLDFGATLEDSVLLPTDDIRKVIWVGSGDAGYVMIFGEDSTCTEGWGIVHLDIEDEEEYPFNGVGVVMSHQTLAPCSLYGSAPLHMHLQWVEDLPLPVYPPGLYNPFDFFEDNLANYDEVQFNHVKWEEFLSPAGNRGIWFIPDGWESYTQLGFALGNPDQNVFQIIVSGAVDIAVAPFSAFQGLSDRDSAGVYSVSYEILRQDPVTLEYLPAASAGNFGQRWLMEMRDELPNGDSPGYVAIFPDGQLTVGGQPDSDWWYNMNAYIVTNSGALDIASWTTGWDNVWTEPYLNDWTTGICQGAWDTNLQLPPNTGDAQTNADAFFPDGRYAVEVTALSHGSREMGIGIDTLPVNDLSLDPSIEGVVVDNFLPHIQGVAVYAKKFGTYQLIYEGYWEDEALDEAMSGESEYLEYLRENLHTLQSEDLSTALPSFCVIDLTESSNQSILNQIGFSESARTSEEYSDVMSTLEPGCCFDEGFGQNAVEFLMEEIARVENQRFLIDFDTTKVLIDNTYGYLTNNTERLILQVFYSEPTMIENSNGQEITDMLHFEGIIGNETEWSSRHNGQFGRLPGGFQLPLPTYDTVSSYSESGNTHYNDSYSVYYVFKGTLPQEYIGHIQLLFGDNQTIGGGPVDLAWHKMDSYPGTVAEARSNYGPFSNQGYETGPDCNYVGGAPDYNHNTSTDIVYGHVGTDLVVSIDLQTIGLEDGVFLGDCDYWCGFWMLDTTPGVMGFDVYIVKPDGTKIPFHFSELSASWGEIQYPTTSNGRYLWLAGFWGSCPGITGTNAIRIDAESGSVYHQNVCKGHAWIDGFGYLSAAQLVEVFEDTDRALFHYGYFTSPYNPGSGVSGYVTLPPSSKNSNDITLISDDIEIDIEVTDIPILEIQGNPISSNLGIICNFSTAEEYELVIYDISGRQVLVDSGVFTSTNSRVDIGVNNLPSGVYLLRIRTGDIEVMRTVSIIH